MLKRAAEAVDKSFRTHPYLSGAAYMTAVAGAGLLAGKLWQRWYFYGRRA